MSFRRSAPAVVLLLLEAACSSSSSPATSADAGGSGDLDATIDAGGFGGPTSAGPSVAGTVTVTPSMTIGKVGAGFVGLSYEKSHLTDGFISARNAPLVALCKLLGPSVLRVGGNSVDATTWDAGAPPTDAGTIGTTFGSADVDALSEFLGATGWSVIYAVGLKSSTPAAAASEATYAASKLGSALVGFEIGNEIDNYGLSYSAVTAKWQAEAEAVVAAVPAATLTGPATASDGLIPSFAAAEKGRIALLTQHYYRGDGTLASSTMAELLAPDPGLTALFHTMSAATNTNAIANGYRIDECNSFYNHGASGVSNAFGSALWVLDYLFENAANGSTGVNFHGGGTGQDGTRPFYYTPIEEAAGAVTGAQPIFYGMLLFTMAGTGELVATTAQAGSLELSAYAVAQANGSTNVVVVNEDATTAVQATVDVGASVTSATGVYLQAASLTAQTGVTLGGEAISAAGVWTPDAPWVLPVAGQTVMVNVPPASAVVVHVL